MSVSRAGLSAETREFVKDESRRVADEARTERDKLMERLGGKMSALEGRMGQVESRLTGVEARLTGVESDTKKAVALGERSVEQGNAILARMDEMEGEVKRVEKRTEAGIEIVETQRRWVKTAKDFHLDKALRTAWKLFAVWGTFKLAGWIGGAHLRDEIFDLLKKVL